MSGPWIALSLFLGAPAWALVPGEAELGSAPSIVEYGELCAERIVEIPDLSCDDATEIPVTIDGERIVDTFQDAQTGAWSVQLQRADGSLHVQPFDGTCDMPNWLGSGACAPFQKLGRVQDLGSDLEVVYICRYYDTRLKGDNDYSDLAMYAHKRSTGETCWFQAYDTGTEKIPSPTRTVEEDGYKKAEDFWDAPSEITGYTCTRCHDADPFMHSPWVSQVTGHNALPVAGSDDGYYSLWFEHRNHYPTPQVMDLSDNPCAACHDLGTMASCGTTGDGPWIEWAVGDQQVPNSRDCLFQPPTNRFMPIGMEPSADEMVCCDDPFDPLCDDPYDEAWWNDAGPDWSWAFQGDWEGLAWVDAIDEVEACCVDGADPQSEDDCTWSPIGLKGTPDLSLGWVWATSPITYSDPATVGLRIDNDGDGDAYAGVLVEIFDAGAGGALLGSDTWHVLTRADESGWDDGEVDYAPPSTSTINGHVVSELVARVTLDPEDVWGTGGTISDEVEILVTDNQHPHASFDAVFTPSAFSMLHSAPSLAGLTTTLSLSSTSSDPDGDPLTYDWTVEAQGAPSGLGGAEYSTVLSVPALFPIPQCLLMGETMVREIPVSLAVSDGLFSATAEADAIFTVTVTDDDGNAVTTPDDEAAYQACISGPSGPTAEELFEVIWDPFCDEMTPNPDGSGPCQGIEALEHLLDARILDAALLEQVYEQAVASRPPDAYLFAEHQAVAAWELAQIEANFGHYSGDAVALILFQQLLAALDDQMTPTDLVERGSAYEELGLGWSVYIESVGQPRSFGLHPSPDQSEAEPIDGSLVMAIEGLGDEADAYLSFAVPDGQSAQMVGFGPRGMVDLTYSFDARSGELWGQLEPGIWSVAVVR